jgi:hypothetical protein
MRASEMDVEFRAWIFVSHASDDLPRARDARSKLPVAVGKAGPVAHEAASHGIRNTDVAIQVTASG